ncbi:MAG: hypothetical protein KDA93_09180 [Planctomycetaceae bacterium]|nr:hypothetical protein [Planctomycetaceae bacterium]
MSKLVRITPEIRSDFVAYLDGELDEQSAERIESVIAQSNVARNDVELLAQTYELLDVLPQYEASAEFTEQTIASVRLSELKPDVREAEWYRQLKQSLPLLALMLALIGIVAVCYLVTNRWVTTEADRLVQDLPVIEQLDLYSEVETIEFLERMVNDGKLLEEMKSQAEDAGGRR